MATIDDVEYPSLLFDDQGSDPSTPASGFSRIYTKSDGAYVIDDAGGVTGPFATASGSAKFVVVNETVVAGSAAANIDFTSISGSYRHLMLVWQGRTNDSGTTLINNMILNNDSSANYDWQRVTTTNTTVTAAVSAAATSLRVGILLGTGAAAANNPGHGVIHIPNYAATVFNKTFHSAGEAYTGTTAATFQAETNTGVWRSTAAITRITLTPSAGSWIIGSTFTLYGLDN